MDLEERSKQVQCVFINDCSRLEETTVVVQGTVVELDKPDPQLHPTRPISLSLDDGTGVLKVAAFRHSSLPHLDQVLACKMLNSTLVILKPMRLEM